MGSRKKTGVREALAEARLSFTKEQQEKILKLMHQRKLRTTWSRFAKQLIIEALDAN